MPEIIFDTCVLSNFALSRNLTLLKSLYPQSAFISDMVTLENLRGLQKGHAPLITVKEALADGWLREVSCSAKEENQMFEKLSVSLGIGEASCIAIASCRGLVFACDDRAARREAALCKVSLTGTVGILVKAVKNGVLDLEMANDILARMIEEGFYSPVAKMTREMIIV